MAFTPLIGRSMYILLQMFLVFRKTILTIYLKHLIYHKKKFLQMVSGYYGIILIPHFKKREALKATSKKLICPKAINGDSEYLKTRIRN